MTRKKRVIGAIVARLRADLEALDSAMAMAHDEASGEESRAEGKYDTRATEASYLAAGQGARLLEMKQLLGWYTALMPEESDKVGLGSLVVIEDERNGRRELFVAPAGGTVVEVDGARVSVISTKAALGQALAGLVEGDFAEVGDNEVELIEVG